MQRELSHHAGPVFSSRSSQFWSILKWRRGRWRLSSTPRFRLKTFCLEDRRASERLHVAAWNMRQHCPHTGWSWGGDWSPLIISPLKVTFNGRPESDTAEMQKPFQRFLKGNDSNENKRPLWVRRMGDIVDPKVSCQASSWLNASPTRRRPGLNCCTGGGGHH